MNFRRQLFLFGLSAFLLASVDLPDAQAQLFRGRFLNRGCGCGWRQTQNSCCDISRACVSSPYDCTICCVPAPKECVGQCSFKYDGVQWIEVDSCDDPANCKCPKPNLGGQAPEAGISVSCDCEGYSSLSPTTFTLTIGTIVDEEHPDPYPTKAYRFSIDPSKSGNDVTQTVKLAVPMIQENQSSSEWWLVEITYTGSNSDLNEPWFLEPLPDTDPPPSESPDQFIVEGIAKDSTFMEKGGVWKESNSNVRVARFGKFSLKLTRQY